MDLIELKIMTNKYGGLIKNQGDLEDSFTCYGKNEVIYLNPDQIQYKTKIKSCKEFYSPNRELGKYFKIHCVNGEEYFLRESEFEKI